MPAALTRPLAYCSRLSGLTTRKRPPLSKSKDLLNVTRPMTVPSFKILNAFAGLGLVHHAHHQPANRSLLNAHRFAGRQAVGRDYHLLVHTRPVRINRDHRHAFGLAIAANRLANHQTPRFETRMFPGRNNVAFDASE